MSVNRSILTRYTLLIATTLIAVALSMRIRLTEDILAFLPDREQVEVPSVASAILLIYEDDGEVSYDVCRSPYGATETRQNALLVDSLQAVAQAEGARLLGAPVVAVQNARCIKRDTVLTLVISLSLITILLLYAFPRRRDILLILLTVGYGWIVGVASLALCFGEVSLIVIGISSILIGIAVNYPLHVLFHHRYTSSVRQTLSEVLRPLVIGNFTTIAAFCALIPMHALALKQLGIFASVMLLATILFSVFFLPLFMSSEPMPVREFHRPQWLRFASVGAILIGLCSYTYFDSDLSHLNYITDQQRADFALLESNPPEQLASEYLLSRPIVGDILPTDSVETALARTRAILSAPATGFLTPYFQRDPLGLRISGMTIDTAKTQIYNDLIATIAPQMGFAEGFFSGYQKTDFRPQADLSISVEQMSQDFDYLGVVCSAIVFVCLVLTFRSLTLALIAFAPMAMAWLLILGTMALFGLQFNIVTIILATFIFGQGDDYTIFVVEGLLYERRTGQKMLSKYRQSIYVSALIMLISMGTLVIARHPAMHALGMTTLLGMTAVVLSSLLLPPLLFRFVK